MTFFKKTKDLELNEKKTCDPLQINYMEIIESKI